MDIRLSLVNKIDGSALHPLTFLIHSFLQNHPNVGTVEICREEICFTKGIFFTVGRIDYAPYQIVCRDGVVRYDGSEKITTAKDDLYVCLINALYQLRPGCVVKI